MPLHVIPQADPSGEPQATVLGAGHDVGHIQLLPEQICPEGHIVPDPGQGFPQAEPSEEPQGIELAAGHEVVHMHVPPEQI